MAQTPAERRAKRDTYARGITDPRTGEPFRNYNALDTYRRNEKAKAEGFKSRAAKRYIELKRYEGEAKLKFPESYPMFVEEMGGRVTEKQARDFLQGFGPYPSEWTPAYAQRSKELRAAYIERMPGWDWRLWREEYASL